MSVLSNENAFSLPQLKEDLNIHNPLVGAAKQGSTAAMEYQLWVSAQSTSLAKLKLFHTMAKSVNDQQ